MKKMISLSLACLMLLSLLVGCDNQDVSGNVTPLPVETTAAPETTVAPETDETVADGPITLGRMEGGIYTNEYAGLGCKLDSNWSFYTATELQELPENISELLSGTEVGQTMDKYPNITDMMAENVTELTSVNVLYQKLDMAMRIAGKTLSQEELVDSVLANQEAMTSSFAAAGIEVETLEKVTVTFLGESRAAIHMTATMQDVAYYTLQILDYSRGDYGVVLTCASFVEDKTASLLELFYEV